LGIHHTGWNEFIFFFLAAGCFMKNLAITPEIVLPNSGGLQLVRKPLHRLLA